MGRTPIAPGTRSKKGGRQLPLQASDEVKFLYDIAWILRNQSGLVAQLVDGSATVGSTVLTGIKLLNTNAESFTTVGGNYRSVSVTITSAGSTGLTIVTDNGTENINGVGTTMKWSVDKPSDLKLGDITITADATVIAFITFTYTA